MTIDFVIPWVDGKDPYWQKQRSIYTNSSKDVEECRFRDWDLLRYWFRAVENYAPWVNRVYLVTWYQIPNWLNTNHPKLRLIDHREYIPQEYLPTFSSHCIELNFHRIPGLSEHFVYFNDDMFLNAPVRPEHFFRNNLPCECAVLGNFTPKNVCDPYTHAQCNVMAYINKYFNKHKVLKQFPMKWYHPGYGKGFLKNVYGSVTKDFSNFSNQHVPSAMLKSTFEIVWSQEHDLLHNTCLNKFRHIADVNQYIMSYYNICTGQFVPRNADFGKCYSIGKNNEEMYADILKGTHKTICLNDHPYIDDFEWQKNMLISLYCRKFPEKSSFEL